MAELQSSISFRIMALLLKVRDFFKPRDDVLKEGMIFTIEPGIYVKDGIRIENDYLVTKHGFEKLTKF